MRNKEKKLNILNNLEGKVSKAKSYFSSITFQYRCNSITIKSVFCIFLCVFISVFILQHTTEQFFESPYARHCASRIKGHNIM